MALKLLDIFFLTFHTAFTIFNMVGWIWKKTRKLHLITTVLTLMSWFLAGIWYGWGYCFCTDWHWQVRAAMGTPIEYNSYIQFLVADFTGWVPDKTFTDVTVLIVFVVCTALTFVLNVRDFLKKREKSVGK